MLDGVKLECNYLDKDVWLEQSKGWDIELEIMERISTKTGLQICEGYQGEYKGLSFKSTQYSGTNGSTHLEITGSLHRYFNNGGANWDIFNFNNIRQMVANLKADFGLIPKLTNIKTLEFGVNVSMPVDAQKVLNSIIFISEGRKKGISWDTNKMNKTVQHWDYGIKIYDKGKAEKTEHGNLVRFEISVKKMRYLDFANIKTLADLTDKNKLLLLAQRLVDVWQSIVYYDGNVRLNELSVAQQLRLEKLTNPKRWTGIHRNVKYKMKQQLKQFVFKNGSNVTEKNVQNAIIRTLENILFMKLSESGENVTRKQKMKAEKKVTFSPVDKGGKRHPDRGQNTPPNDMGKTSPKNKEKTAVKKGGCVAQKCLVCDRDISHQKKGSRFCSEKYYGKDGRRCRNAFHNKRNNQLRAKRKKAISQHIVKKGAIQELELTA